jgi:hypothetical protein
MMRYPVGDRMADKGLGPGYEVLVTEDRGRVLVATKAFAAGDVVFEEPAITMYKHGTFPSSPSQISCPKSVSQCATFALRHCAHATSSFWTVLCLQRQWKTRSAATLKCSRFLLSARSTRRSSTSRCTSSCSRSKSCAQCGISTAPVSCLSHVVVCSHDTMLFFVACFC